MTIAEKFEALNVQKKERILNAAMEEFLRNGYEKASTNEIVKVADISKGSLFNYFSSKNKLYFYLIDYAVGLMEKIFRELNLEERDFFNRLRDLGLIKLRTMKRTPRLFDFLTSLGKETSPEVRQELEAIKKRVIESGIARLYENVDYSKFRKDLDLEKMMNMINWTMLGYSEQENAKLKSHEEVSMKQIEEFDGYIEIMKRCFYQL
jgi:AcrR family transcriptional regulator